MKIAFMATHAHYLCIPLTSKSAKHFGYTIWREYKISSISMKH